MLSEQLQIITEKNGWKAYAETLLNHGQLTPEAKEKLGTYWIVAGHRIRDQIGDDRFLIRFLRFVLPPYEGDALELYRGENLYRWNKRIIGLAWTSDINVARMFGRGLNAVGSGGVLLKASFNPGDILTNALIFRHSTQLSHFKIKLFMS